MLLTGTFTRSLDEKSRVAIPRALREDMACPKGGILFVAPGTDQSLGIYTQGAFEQLARRFTEVPPTREDVRAFARLFYARAQRVEVDSQGRVRIPSDLVDLAALGREVVLLGVQDHLELWSAPRWQSYLAEKQGQYDRNAETTFGRVRSE